ncbi:MAG: hypothetical protein ABIA04_14825 [Pseudomonadota bacterium]
MTKKSTIILSILYIIIFFSIHALQADQSKVKISKEMILNYLMIRHPILLPLFSASGCASYCSVPEIYIESNKISNDVINRIEAYLYEMISIYPEFTCNVNNIRIVLESKINDECDTTDEIKEKFGGAAGCFQRGLKQDIILSDDILVLNGISTELYPDLDNSTKHVILHEFVHSRQHTIGEGNDDFGYDNFLKQFEDDSRYGNEYSEANEASFINSYAIYKPIEDHAELISYGFHLPIEFQYSTNASFQKKLSFVEKQWQKRDFEINPVSTKNYSISASEPSFSSKNNNITVYNGEPVEVRIEAHGFDNRTLSIRNLSNSAITEIEFQSSSHPDNDDFFFTDKYLIFSGFYHPTEGLGVDCFVMLDLATKESEIIAIPQEISAYFENNLTVVNNYYFLYFLPGNLGVISGTPKGYVLNLITKEISSFSLFGEHLDFTHNEDHFLKYSHCEWDNPYIGIYSQNSAKVFIFDLQRQKIIDYVNTPGIVTNHLVVNKNKEVFMMDIFEDPETKAFDYLMLHGDAENGLKFINKNLPGYGDFKDHIKYNRDPKKIISAANNFTVYFDNLIFEDPFAEDGGRVLEIKLN